MRERSWISRLLVALAVFVGLSVLAAPSASAACIGGVDYIGVNPGGPIKVGEAAYPTGPNLFTVPQWYGYDPPAITTWYIESSNGVINNGERCSTSDFMGLFNQAIPQGLTTFAGGLLAIDYSLLDIGSVASDWTTNTQETIQNFINSGPYQNLYTILALLVLAVGTVTVLLLVLTQDQRDRSDLMRTLMSGGSVRSRRSAAIKEVGWIVLSIAVFGGIVAGLPYWVQTTVNNISSDFSGAIQYELNNFSTDINGRTTQTDNICLTGFTPTGTTTDTTSSIKCNLYRIYQWTPWLVMQFGGTNAGDYAIDTSNPAVTESDELKKAIEQVRAKFGDDAAALAPYLQMQILQGNNNEGWSGQRELTSEERIQAFRSLGRAIDESPTTQSWALQWAGHGSAQFGRSFEAFITLMFVLIIVWPVLTIILLGNVIAGYAAAILPIFGLFFAVLIGMRQTRKKGMKILKWWIYALLIPPLVSLALTLSLTVALIFTGLIDFSGFGLFLYLVISSLAFIGTLLYLVYLFRGQAKRLAGSVDGTADEPGVVSKVAGAAAPLVGNAIAPGIGGAIGGAIGAGIATNDEPRPQGMDDMEPNSGEEERPSLPSGPTGRAGLAAPVGIGPRVGGPSAYGNDYDDDDIVDAEIIEDNEFPAGRVIAAGAITAGAYGLGGEEPRVGPYVEPPKAIGTGSEQSEQAASEEPQFAAGDGERMIQEATAVGVNRIIQTTNAAAIFLDDVATERTEQVVAGADEAARAFTEAASQASATQAEQLRGAADEARVAATESASRVRAAGAEERQGVNVEGEGERRRLFRSSSEAVKEVETAQQKSDGRMAESVAAAQGLSESIAKTEMRIEEHVSELDQSGEEVRQAAEELKEGRKRS